MMRLHHLVFPCILPTRRETDHIWSWLYLRLIHLRRVEQALVAGDYVPIRSRNDILMYQRLSGSEELLVALNTVHQPRKIEWQSAGTLLLSTYLDSDGKVMAGSILLRADEGHHR